MSSSLFGIISLITTILMAFLLLGGIIITAVKRREHGRGAMLGMVGCVLLLVSVVLAIAQGFLLPIMGLDLLTASAFLNILHLLINASGTALLIAGVVARRQPPQQAQGPYQPQSPYPHQPQPDWGQQPQQPGWQQPQQPPGQQPGWQQPPRPPFGGNQG